VTINFHYILIGVKQKLALAAYLHKKTVLPSVREGGGEGEQVGVG